MRMIIGTLLSVAALLALPQVSEARTDRELTYRSSQIWHSAIRFIRVDQGFKIVEKDKEAGYLMFDYEDAGRVYPATLELVSTVNQGRKVIRTRLRIQRMPSYVEAVLLDKFLRKLKDEYGAPPPAQLVEEPSAQQPSANGKAASGGNGGAEGAEDEQDLETDEDELEDSTKEQE